MPGLVPGIHDLKTWIAGTSPAMTNFVESRRIMNYERFRTVRTSMRFTGSLMCTMRWT
jgi:hypothetical protein